MRNDAPLPFPPRAEAASSLAAELAGWFRHELTTAGTGAGDLTDGAAVSYDWIERYVDGALSADEFEQFTAHLASDALLAQEVRDLEQLRASISRPSVQPRLTPAQPAVRWRRLVGLAAALGLAVLGAERLLEYRIQADPQGVAVASSSIAEAQPLMVDGFESGDSTGWTR